MKKPLGIVLYKGPSKFDGKPIMVIATGISNKTDNEKTGDMIQTWILRRDFPPIEAVKYGHDYSVCYLCKHRDAGSCYVNIAFGPHNVFKAYHNDKYVDFKPEHLELFKGKSIRLGSYGDPAAVDISVWENICSVAGSWTGYSHQWGLQSVSKELKKYCMASCDNEKECVRAKKLGWRTFRIRLDSNDSMLENEFICPASNEAGNKTNCKKCKACMGISAHTNKTPAIIIHGLEHKIKKFRWVMQRISWKEKYRKKFDYPLPKKRKKAKAPEVKKLEPMSV